MCSHYCVAKHMSLNKIYPDITINPALIAFHKWYWISSPCLRCPSGHPHIHHSICSSTKYIFHWWADRELFTDITINPAMIGFHKWYWVSSPYLCCPSGHPYIHHSMCNSTKYVFHWWANQEPFTLRTFALTFSVF